MISVKIKNTVGVFKSPASTECSIQWLGLRLEYRPDYMNSTFFAHLILLDLIIVMIFGEDYRLIAERWFARTNDRESYAGGSVGCW
jgi:hypothetical protein